MRPFAPFAPFAPSLFAAAILCSSSLAARADSMQQSVTANGTATQNNGGFVGVASTSFLEFNSAAGKLNSVTISLSGKATGIVRKRLA